MDEKNWRLTALVEIILLVLAVAMFLSHTYHEVPAPMQFDGLQVIYKRIDSPQDIEPLEGPIIPPIAYTCVISLDNLDLAEKKRKFFDMLLPAVLISEHKLSQLRQRINDCITREERSEAEQQWLDEQMKLFEAGDYQQLLRRTNSHPVSIILAQAALESGWGESRFFEQANNVFGIWSFDPLEPRIKAGANRQGKAIYIKKYRSLIESVDDYFLTIARGPYRGFRYAREKEDNPFLLVKYLSRYSEQGKKYTRRLRNVIVNNDLQRFDACRLDPAFLLKASFQTQHM